MKRVLLLLALLLLFTDAVLADGPEVHWSVVAGGGGAASDGLYGLGATVGQGASGVATDGAYILQAGFWHTLGPFAPSQEHHRIYLPLVIRQA